MAGTRALGALDALDAAILAALAQDGRLSQRAVARRVGSTAPTVGARLRRLRDTGVLPPIRAQPAAPRATLVAVLRVAAAHEAAVAAALQGAPDVAEVVRLEGGVLHVRCGPGQRWRGLLAALPGLVSVELLHVLGQQSGAAAGAPGPAGVRCHQCGGPVHAPLRTRLGGRSQVFCCTQCRATFAQRWQRLQAPGPGTPPAPPAAAPRAAKTP